MFAVAGCVYEKCARGLWPLKGLLQHPSDQAFIVVQGVKGAGLCFVRQLEGRWGVVGVSVQR